MVMGFDRNSQRLHRQHHLGAEILHAVGRRNRKIPGAKAASTTSHAVRHRSRSSSQSWKSMLGQPSIRAGVVVPHPALWPDLAKTRISARDARSHMLRTVANRAIPRLISKKRTSLV